MNSTRRQLLCHTAALLGLTACGRALAASTQVESRPVAGFDAVVWAAIGELFIEQTDREHLTVEAEPAVLGKLVTQVRQGRLWIELANGRIQTQEPIRFRLEVRALHSIETRGSGAVHIGALQVPGLTLRLAGSGAVRLARLQARRLDVRLEGAGNVTIDGGAVDRQQVVIAGAGNYAAWPMASRVADVAIDGSGELRLAVTQRLRAGIAGSGAVRYRGRPEVSQTVTGAGTVSAAGEEAS